MASSQISQALALGSYFFTGVLAINTSQVLGAPLYLVNKDWYNAWVAFTKQSFNLLTVSLTQWWAPTVVRASGDESVRGQLLQTVDGHLLCNFPQRLVLIANHQIYTDWMYLWWIAYTGGMHGRVYIILKESLRRIPLIGWGMQLCQFIFLKRNWEKDKAHLSTHLQSLNKPFDPMWLLMFPEGTNLAPSTRQKSREWAAKNGIKDMQHVLIPRSTGLQFCLQEMRKTVSFVYDCTIAYEGVPRGQYAQDIFTIRASYLEGRPPKTIHMYWRRFSIASIPIDDSKAFELWLRARWIEKDYLIENWYRTGSFPADKGVDISPGGKTRRGAGHVETVIKAMHWYEFLQAFMPVSLLGLVLYAFYGALPQSIWKAIKGNNNETLVERFNTLQDNLVRSAQRKLLEFAQGGSSGKRKIGAKKPIVHQRPAVRGLITQGAHANTSAPHRAVAANRISNKPSQDVVKRANNPSSKVSQKQVDLARRPQQQQQAMMKGSAKNLPSTKAITKSKAAQPKKLAPKMQSASVSRKVDPKPPNRIPAPSSISNKPGKLSQKKALPSKASPAKKTGTKKNAPLPQRKKVRFESKG